MASDLMPNSSLYIRDVLTTISIMEDEMSDDSYVEGVEVYIMPCANIEPDQHITENMKMGYTLNLELVLEDVVSALNIVHDFNSLPCSTSADFYAK